jgi:hypothetical protein
MKMATMTKNEWVKKYTFRVWFDYLGNGWWIDGYMAVNPLTEEQREWLGLTSPIQSASAGGVAISRGHVVWLDGVSHYCPPITQLNMPPFDVR